MYEMYPDDWAATPQPSPNGDQPRRRARKEHRVIPSILVVEDSATEEETEDQK